MYLTIEESIQYLCQSAKVTEGKVHIFFPEKRIGAGDHTSGSFKYTQTFQQSHLHGIQWHDNTATTAKDLSAILESSKTKGDAIWVWGVNSPVSNELFKQRDVPFEVWTEVRSDTGWWQQREHIGSLPIGKLSSEAWLKRIAEVELTPIDTGAIVRMKIGTEPSVNTFRSTSGEISDEEELDIGELEERVGEREKWVEITVEGEPSELAPLHALREKKRARAINRRKRPNGHVRWTLELPEAELVQVEQQLPKFFIMRRTHKASEGVLLLVEGQQWEQLAALALAENWTLTRESPKWVAISCATVGKASTEPLTVELLSKLNSWRKAGAVSDIAFCFLYEGHCC